MTTPLPHSQHRFTLLEVILALAIMLIVLLPIALLVSASIRDWQRSRQIRMLQEDLHLASHTVKGVTEEAFDYNVAEDETAITLTLEDQERSVTIQRDDSRLMIGDETIIDCLTNFSCEDLGRGKIHISLSVERSNQTQQNEFIVSLRNYQR
ncbi:MAG: PulJ/GspJ family protein [Planctomycetota bacterium]